MAKVKYGVTATVPVAQYANLQPTVEVEADSIEEAEAIVLPYIEEFFNKYSDKAKIGAAKNVQSKTRILEKDIFGNEIYYDDSIHEYTNTLGEIYLGGSTYAAQFEAPFNGEMISGKMVKKAGLDEEVGQAIQDMWRLKADASASLGTAIHSALELYGKYREVAESVGKETHVHDNTILNKAVLSFYKEHPVTTEIEYEALIVDHKMKRAGRVDRLEYDEDGVWVTDFKTNFDVKKSIKKYWRQLSFYAAILKANGLTVKGLKIYHYANDTWVTIEGKVIDIDAE